MNFKAATLIIIFLFVNQSQAWVSVGSSPNFGTCDYLTIQEALDSNELEIRVLNNQEFIENILIDHSVDIKGGYASCLSASLNSSSSTKTIIKGTSIIGKPVIEIAATDSPTIRLQNLTLRDAADTILVDGGRGLKIGSSNGLVEIIDTLIVNNTAETGGGIYIDNTESSVSLVITNSTLLGNTASAQGGGIYCNGSDVTIRVSGTSLIGENFAEDGGGIAALSGCSVTVDSGSDLSSEIRGIIANTASQYGGGIYLSGFAKLFLEGNKYAFNILGDNTNPVTVANNTSQNHGGGIYAINSSSIEITDGYIFNNSTSIATGRGGGIYLGGSIVFLPEVSLQIHSSNTQCWKNGQCSIIANNRAKSGGAIHIEQGTNATITNTHIFENTANFGTAIYVWDNGESGTITNLDGNYFYKNGNNGSGTTGDKFVVRLNGDVSVTMLHNTIADNDVDDSRAIIGIVGGVNLTIKNSILSNNPETILEETGLNTSNYSCVIASDLTVEGSLLFATNFVDSANNNYHLSADSGAIDTCASASPLFIDTDNEIRGWDDNTISNFNGAFDAGADETYFNDIIYTNGFE